MIVFHHRWRCLYSWAVMTLLLTTSTVVSSLSTIADSHNKKRVVVLVGPHKSASSSVQEFLIQYTTGRPKYRKLRAFQQWRWPVVTSNTSTTVPTRKQWSSLVLSSSNNNSTTTSVNKDAHHISSLHQAFLDAYRYRPNVNMVVGSEEMDRFGATPWSHRNGIAAVETLQSWVRQETPTNTPLLEVVVNYRTPRRTQWISIWKQLMAMDELLLQQQKEEEQQSSSLFSSYADWVCRDSVRMWEYWDAVANPLGLARTYQHHGFPVTLVDMGGVAAQGLDIAHVTACHVLGVPCSRPSNHTTTGGSPTGSWVKGIDQRRLVVNSKSRSLEGVLSPFHLQELEELMRLRDCLYHEAAAVKRKKNNHPLTILFADSLWQDCPKRTGNADSKVHGMLSQLRNATFCAQLLQSQCGCGGSSDNNNDINLTSFLSHFHAERAMQDKLVEEMSRPTSHAGGVDDHTSQRHGDNVLLLPIQVVQWIFVGLLFGGVFGGATRRRAKR